MTGKTRTMPAHKGRLLFLTVDTGEALLVCSALEKATFLNAQSEYTRARGKASHAIRSIGRCNWVRLKKLRAAGMGNARRSRGRVTSERWSGCRDRL